MRIKASSLYLAAALLLPAARLSARTTAEHMTWSNLRVIEAAIETFALVHKRLPSQTEGLDALVGRPIGLAAESSYEPFLREIPMDAWGQPFVYVVPGRHRLESFDLYSLGADGKSSSGGNDSDDISVWDDDHKWSRYYTRAANMRKLRQFAPIGAGIIVLLVLLLLFRRLLPSNFRELRNG